MEMLSTQIDAQDTTFIEIWKSFWKNLKNWPTMADFQKIKISQNQPNLAIFRPKTAKKLAKIAEFLPFKK